MAAQGAVGADLVVVDAEGVELTLEGRQAVGGALHGEVALERLVEAFDLAAGLGMVGGGVLAEDAEAVQFGLEEDPSLAGFAAEDGSVVAEQGGREAVSLSCGVERLDDVWCFDGAVGVRRQAEARVIVDEVEDLDAGAVGELPVGGVGLPHLVGEVGFEAYNRRPRALLGLGDDQAVATQDPPDGGGGRGRCRSGSQGDGRWCGGRRRARGR